MIIEAASKPLHNGVETYVATFSLTGFTDEHDVKGAYVQYTIRPDQMNLVWERFRQNAGWSPWRRVTYPSRGLFSAISGQRVVSGGGVSNSESQRSYVEVFGQRHLFGNLTPYAAARPGLEKMVTLAEYALPA